LIFISFDRDVYTYVDMVSFYLVRDDLIHVYYTCICYLYHLYFFV